MDLKSEKNNSLLQKVEDLAGELLQLVKSASHLSSVYQSKAADEAELPTVSSALRNTNQVIFLISGALAAIFPKYHLISRKFPKRGSTNLFSFIMFPFRVRWTPVLRVVTHDLLNKAAALNHKVLL